MLPLPRDVFASLFSQYIGIIHYYPLLKGQRQIQKTLLFIPRVQQIKTKAASAN